MENLVSIIVPVYNCEKYIDECVQSLINQTYIDIEIIIINDGSTDKSQKICKEYVLKDNRIKLFNICNKGVSNARNIGIENAKGNYIMFVDADDFLEKNAVEKLVNYLEKETLELIIFDKNRIINGKKVIDDKNVQKNELISGIDLKKIVISENIIYNTVWNEIISTKLLKEKKIKFNTNYMIAEDLLFNVELFDNVEKVMIVGDKLYNYRININSTCNADNKQKIIARIRDTIIVYNIFFEYLEKWEKENTAENREILSKKMLFAVNFELEKLVLSDNISKMEKKRILKEFFEKTEIEFARKNIKNSKRMKNQVKFIYKNKINLYFYYVKILGIYRNIRRKI